MQGVNWAGGGERVVMLRMENGRCDEKKKEARQKENKRRKKEQSTTGGYCCYCSIEQMPY